MDRESKKTYLNLYPFNFSERSLLASLGSALPFPFIGGGGTPYAIQNVLPIIFDLSIKKYFVATLIGSAPSMFIMTALGSGIERVIDKNETISIIQVAKSPEIYLPLTGFFIILILAFIVKKFFFKTT